MTGPAGWRPDAVSRQTIAVQMLVERTPPSVVTRQTIDWRGGVATGHA
jgi:hypothetical protein